MDVRSLVQILLIVSGFLFVIGLIRPGFVVFWSANKSRSSVLAVWGGLTLVLAILAFVLTGSKDDTAKVGLSNPVEIVWKG